MEVLESSLSGVPLIRVVGDVDHYTSRALDGAAREALTHDSGRLLLDFSRCLYVDSSGVGVLGASVNLLRVFEIVGLLNEPCFRVFADEMEASAALLDAAR